MWQAHDDEHENDGNDVDDNYDDSVKSGSIGAGFNCINVMLLLLSLDGTIMDFSEDAKLSKFILSIAAQQVVSSGFQRFRWFEWNNVSVSDKELSLMMVDWRIDGWTDK